MERLTKQGQDFENQFCDEVNCRFYGEPNGCNNPNYSCSSFCYFTSVAEMLEKYEDTELTPELIEAMRGHNSELINQNADLQAENAALKARLDKAVELPCKVGDTVYVFMSKIIIGEDKCTKCKYYHEGDSYFGDFSCCLYKDEFDEENIECILIYEWKNVDLGFIASKINEFGKTVFLTEAKHRQNLRN